jgi:hypothetical protein
MLHPCNCIDVLLSRSQNGVIRLSAMDGLAVSIIFPTKGSPMDDENLVVMQSPAAARDRVQVRPSPLEIYSVGRDKDILRRRERMIAGRSQLSVRSLLPWEAEKFVRDPEARLWIFCSSIELGSLVHLACCVRRHSPGSRLVLMRGRRNAGFEASLFHEVVAALEGPDSLFEAVSRLAVAV